MGKNPYMPVIEPEIRIERDTSVLRGWSQETLTEDRKSTVRRRKPLRDVWP